MNPAILFCKVNSSTGDEAGARAEPPTQSPSLRNLEQEKDKEIRDLEEAVRLLEEEIQGFRERKKELKRELKTLKKKIAGVEMETSKTRQTKQEWKKEMEAMKERMIQEEKQREEKRTGQREVICKEIIITVAKTERKMEEKKEKQDDRKMATVSERQEVVKEKKSEEELLEEMEKQREEEQLKERRESQEATESRKEVVIEIENLQMEPAAPSTSRKNVVQRVLSSVLSSIHSGIQSFIEFRKKFSIQPVQDEKEELKDKSPSRPLVPLGAPTGVLTIRIRSCRDFRKNTRIQKDTQCMVRITVGRMVKCSRLQPFEDNLTFSEVKHFSIQIQKEGALGVQESSSVKVDLISFGGDSAAPKLMGSTTIKLQEVLFQKSSVSQQIDLRLGNKKVCKLDADLTFTYGSFGYGYSHQMKHPGRKMKNLVEESLFLRCPPPEDRRDPHYNVTTPCRPSSVNIMSSLIQRDAQRDNKCRISAGIMNCMERRGRLSQLHKDLEDCETGEDRVQLLESLILKTGTRTSSPCKTNQSTEIRSEEAEERRREENSEDGKAEETVKKGKAKCKNTK
ncbi:C2 calcium-dependent domain-containing protein 6-like [Colossoma macropomum]|uniref:C2 calcium-dependent domain-containing protein 6-like n=1 Tax=Colossoma macropomum TaxID=42526 RepID=UPI001863F14E|nr:C2 calcium-dependent domain-containing protein 6-like [Colossoma macropomum]